MPKAIAKTEKQTHISSKLHEHLKKHSKVKASLKDIQQSLADVGISLSKRVIEERKSR